MGEARTAIVTGAGSGIGASTALLLAERGWNVVAAGRREETVLETASRGAQGRVIAAACDVAMPQAVTDLFDTTRARFGPVDAVVCAAAIIEVTPFADLPLDEWQRTLDVNVTGTMLCARQLWAQCAASGRGASLVTISSLGGIRATDKFPGFVAYSASKAAVVGLTEALAAEGKGLGIRANCVAPGAVDTKMLRKAAPQLTSQTTPLDVAKVIAYLCDATESGALTGSTIEVFSNG